MTYRPPAGPHDPQPRRGGSGGAVGPVARTGPNGERLVRTSKFAALGSIWSMDCSVSCSGVAL